MTKITINSYSLSIHGLCLDYSTDREKFNVFYDPKSTCDLLEDLHAIDGWDSDKNNEPVILGQREHDYFDEQDNLQWTVRPVHIHWCDFVNTFALLPRQLELLAEHHYSLQLSQRIMDKINRLLSPNTIPSLQTIA